MTSKRTRGWALAAAAPVVWGAVWAATPAFAAKRPVLAMSAEQRREAFARAGLDPAGVVDPIAADDDLRARALEVAGEGTDRERLIHLQRHLFDPDTYEFDYETRRTLTATEAYEAERGNCVSFTNLFIALSRSLGIPVHASIAFTERSEEELDDLVILNSHLVAVYPDRQRLLVFDFERRAKRIPIGYEAIDDAWLTAVYYNNLGVESLVADDLDSARRQLETATALAPEFVDAWTNLAVVYRRQGDAEAALDTHLLALRLEPDNRAVRDNLRAIHAIRAREGEPATGLLGRADEELAGGRPTVALRLFRRAAREDPDSAAARLGIARALIVKGRVEGAVKALRRAVELDPEDGEAKRLLRGLTAP